MRRAQQLGRYHLLDRIAFGGMAEIYRAKTFDVGGHAHVVAVKRVLANLAEDDDFIQMLVDEARIAALVRHPNIARVYEFARAHGEYFIAMEHVDGKDLRSLLERCRQRKQPMPPDHAAFVGAEIAAGLHAAHTATDSRNRPLRIVHRDVSPSNVIASYAGDVKLCDFGIAKATLSRVRTRTGVIKGKVKYMSPEQALGRKLDHRSDIFSLGGCLYEMLTRVPPFTAANEMELLVKVRDARYRPVSELAPGVPATLEAITDRCLSRSRSQRYQTAAEVEQDLRAFLRREAPSYGKALLGRYVRATFAAEIERELRMLEEYVIADDVSDDLGENLIRRGEDARPADVPFQPKPTRTVLPAVRPAPGETAEVSASGSADADATATTDAAGFDLHGADTVIMDTRGRRVAPSPRADGPARGHPAAAAAPRSSAPPDDDLHGAATQIIDLARRPPRP